MSIPKAARIETEYGIFVWGAETFNPFLASQLVLNAYQTVGGPAIPMGVYYNVQTGDIEEEADDEEREEGEEEDTETELPTISSAAPTCCSASIETSRIIRRIVQQQRYN
jgi:hypothetical protein